jgi:hypothetical protein
MFELHQQHECAHMSVYTLHSSQGEMVQDMKNRGRLKKPGLSKPRGTG